VFVAVGDEKVGQGLAAQGTPDQADNGTHWWVSRAVQARKSVAMDHERTQPGLVNSLKVSRFCDQY
jgi:hypothetical protein